jgi:hypothetical protein
MQPEWSPLAKVLGALERLRGGDVILAERLPTGELVIMTREVFDKHVRLERARDISLEDVQKLVRTPDYIYKDGRPVAGARGKYFAVKLKPDPFGKVKMKRLIAHLKRCRKLLVFEVSYVSTVLLAKKLPPQSKELWRKPGLLTS